MSSDSKQASPIEYESIQTSSTSTPFKSIRFYRYTTLGLLLYLLLCVVSLGIFYILAHWYTGLKMWARCKECQPSEATVVLAKLLHHIWVESAVRTVTVSRRAMGYKDSPDRIEVKLCDIQHQTYVYIEDRDTFEPLEFHTNLSYEEFRERLGGGILDDTMEEDRLNLYGKCLMDVPVPSHVQIFKEEVLHPFFLFQVFSMILWTFEAYYIYAVVILVLSLGSIIISILQTRENLGKVRSMAYFESEVRILRKTDTAFVEETENSTKLVPGTLLRLESDWVAPCDLVLLTGSCVVNEGMLTGESAPVLKDALPNHSSDNYTPEKDKKYTVFAGTKVVQIRNEAMGVVVATGFATVKGSIMRAILFPKPSRLNFHQDSMKFVGILGAMAVLGFTISFYSMLRSDMTTSGMIMSSLDLITIAVPPALPIAMTVGISFAIYRLEKANIICISPPAINSAGSVSVVCCDKTGTLTEDLMLFYGVISSTHNQFGKYSKEKSEIPENLITVLSCCHSLTFIDGVIAGDPLELSLFQELGLELTEQEEKKSVSVLGKTLEIVQTFYFSSLLKRMGVVVYDPSTSEFSLYMKGAPEEIRKLCESVPSDFNETVRNLSRQGLRVLACAYKSLSSFSPSQSLSSLEASLSFAGLLMFHNQLKSETPEIVETLSEAGYQFVISTGDSTLTGLAVAYDSGIIPTLTETYVAEFESKTQEVVWEKHSGTHIERLGPSTEWLNRLRTSDTDFAIAINGKTLRSLMELEEFRTAMPFLLEQLRVCGRMSPYDKSVLVDEFKGQGHIVAMCGDGANDCGALKSADVGLSVSREEASIAAPFSAPTLSSVSTLFREGKAALATSFQCFKFMALYSMIQLTTVTFLYLLQTNLMDVQFMYIDILLVLPLTFAMGDVDAYQKLTRDQLPRVLLSFPILVSFFGQVIIQALFHVFAYLLLLTQNWYSHESEGIQDPDQDDDNTVLFLISIFQYLNVCLSFNIGPPFRLPAYTNWRFSAVFLILTAVNLYVLLLPSEFVRSLLGVSLI